MADILRERERQVYRKGQEQSFQLDCEKQSVAGSVSQRACVFCGSRVVLYPIADALHIVHGPIGCASYTWDIRGALSSGPELHRLSFSTDLQELDVVHGGEKKLLRRALRADRRTPAEGGVRLCHLHRRRDRRRRGGGLQAREPGKGNSGAAGALGGLQGNQERRLPRGLRRAAASWSAPARPKASARTSINILGDFNLAGETWMIRDYYKRMGVEVVSCITGDGRIDDIRRAHGAALNVVQCSGSMTHLAKSMKEKYGIPFMRVSYFGVEDMSKSLYDVAAPLQGPGDAASARRTGPRRAGADHAAAGRVPEGPRRASARRSTWAGPSRRFRWSRALRHLGMKTVMVGSQTGNKDDYEQLRRALRRGHDHRRRLEPAGAVQLPGGKRCGPVHRRREGASHRLQAGHRILRSQPRAQGSAGRL